MSGVDATVMEHSGPDVSLICALNCLGPSAPGDQPFGNRRFGVSGIHGRPGKHTWRCFSSFGRYVHPFCIRFHDAR